MAEVNNIQEDCDMAKASCFSPQRPGFIFRTAYRGVTVDKLALAGFLQAFQFTSSNHFIITVIPGFLVSKNPRDLVRLHS
jgi:hypothetical protein